ncbi:hypothetical protein [Acinetobacter radioresistens]|uniref:hypothetical protein n=1 Tax=Acinetobacter radioresistens TaxID=40216 RepID=UPI0035CD1E5F
MTNNYDLDEDILNMSRDELLDEVADRIQAIRELMKIHRVEERMLKQENQVLQDALNRGVSVMDHATKRMQEYEVLMKQSTKTILMWRTNCYLLTAILVIVAIVLMIR